MAMVFQIAQYRNGCTQYHTVFQYVIIWKNLQVFTICHQSSTKFCVSSTQQRDTKDVKIFVDWFHLHSSLSYSENDKLVSIGTGEVADSMVNYDKAYTIGIKAAYEVTGKEFT